MNNVGAEANKTNQMAVAANLALFDREGTAKLIERSPHLKHLSIRQLYARLVLRVFTTAKRYSAAPRVLDVGAGDGSATLPFLELGARVTAVDMSESQLAVLAKRCRLFNDRLEVRYGAIDEVIRQMEDRYDIVVMNSFLHHVPDYLGTISEALSVLHPNGQFFSFQDPLRYDTLRSGTMIFSELAYFSWRAFQGDYVRGLKTRFRRIRGTYIPGSVEDDAEYHVTRNGVDQHAIAGCMESSGFSWEIIPYFSTQSRMFQAIGEFLCIENTFGIVAQKVV